MEKGLLGKFVSDGNFVEFCKMVDRQKERRESIRMPFEVASMLFDAGVDFVKGDWSLDIVHQAVKGSWKAHLRERGSMNILLPGVRRVWKGIAAVGSKNYSNICSSAYKAGKWRNRHED